MPDFSIEGDWVRIHFGAISKLMYFRSLHDAPVQLAVEMRPGYKQ